MAEVSETLADASHIQAPLIIWHEGMEALGSAACAFGVFDGVHHGHQFIISRALADARVRGIGAYIITFDRDPEEQLHPDAPCRKLLSNEDRLSLLARTGVDGVLVIPFEKGLSGLSPNAFCETVIKSAFPTCFLHTGEDFRYGTRALGTAATLNNWAHVYGGSLTAHKLYDEEGAAVSATRIRGLLQESQLGEATRLLTRPFYLTGIVVEGRREGSRMGIPTANLKTAYPAVTLGDGVYGGYVHVDGLRYRAAISVGAASTFGVDVFSIEPHLLDFEGDLYGKTITLYFISYLRPMKTFDSPEELKEAIMCDIDWTRENL